LSSLDLVKVSPGGWCPVEVQRETTPVTPEEAVAHLASIVGARKEFSADDIYAAMATDGIPEAVADRAYKFTQIAWGQAFLANLGVRFAPNYFCFNSAGEVTESGLLNEEPFFCAALQVAKQPRSPGFARFAAMSADVSAVNAALHAGSRPENLVTDPPAIFLEAPTPDGISKARRFLAAWRGSQNRVPLESSSPNKPWWRLWR
jgi:hypothetical protein